MIQHLDDSVSYEDGPITADNFFLDDKDEIIEIIEKRMEELQDDLIILQAMRAHHARTRVGGERDLVEKSLQGIQQMMEAHDDGIKELHRTIMALSRTLQDLRGENPDPPKMEVRRNRILAPNSDITPVHGNLVEG